MCATHTCIRSALSQAFRPQHRIAASASIPEFLVPALARPPRQPFSSARRRQTQAHTSSHVPPGRSGDAENVVYHPKPAARSPFQRIEPSEARDHGDIEQWLNAIDRSLPPHLRREPGGCDVSASIKPTRIASVLNAAQDALQDVLGYMGLVEKRWDAVIWLVRRLAEGGRQSIESPSELEPFLNVMWPETEFRSLDDLTNSPLLTQRVRPSRPLKQTLDDLTAAPESINLKQVQVKQALGQLWRSLGSMIMAAAQEAHTDEDTVMPHVLEIIAHLHHVGLIPDSLYAHRPNPGHLALQQPPTLHLLSSKILTALSDATWRAHEASVKVAKERMNANYFLGHEIPGSRYKVRVTEVAPELWLELVLWSCLHGGWTLDAAFILEQMRVDQGGSGWGLISWQELVQAQEQETDATSGGWGIFRHRVNAAPQPDDRARTRRRISSEAVTACVDGLVNNMRMGVGSRGTDPEDLVGHIKKLKKLLDANSMSLGSATWDSVMIRILESGGVVPEKRPELLLSILDLAPGFGSEVTAVNASSEAASGPEKPYILEPSTVPISLLHRTIRSFVDNGGISGAMATLMVLQQYTDRNKQQSLQQFFESLKNAPFQPDEPFSSHIPPIHFPAFDTQLPVRLLAKLLILATESRLYDLARWFVFSEDLDGPLIDPSMYGDWAMSASLVQFGTMAGEADLVLKIVEKALTWSDRHQTQRMPAELFTALFSSQVKLRRWESVQGMQQYVLETPGYRPRSELVASLVAEMLRLSKETSETEVSQKEEACNAFKELLFAWEGLILTNMRNQLYCMLGIMSTVDEEWKEFCSQFLAFSSRQTVKLSTVDFNQLLGGLLDGYGSTKGRKLVDDWCYTPPKTFEPYRASGGLPTMSKHRVRKAEEYESKPDDMEIVQQSGTTLILQGRVKANRQTVWAVLRKVQQEEDARQERGAPLSEAERVEVSETLRWAAKLLYYLGFDYEDIVRDLGSLAEMAELEAPAAPRVVGLPGGAQGS